MYRNRQSQGFSITIIVAAVIGLMSIVIVIALLSGKLGGFSKGVDEQGDLAKKCEDLDGTITLRSQGCTSPAVEIQAADTSIDPKKICCK